MKAQYIHAVIRFSVVAETWRGGPKKTSLRPHFHEEVQIILSEHRLVSYEIKGARILSPLGTLFLIEPGLVHSAEVGEHQPSWGDLRTLMIPRSSFPFYLGDAVRKVDLSFGSPLCPNGLMLRFFSQTHSLLVQGDDLSAEHSLVESLAALADKTSPSTEWKRTPRSGRLRRIRERLGSSLSEPLSLSELAEDVGLSPFHLSREFRASFGMPPHAYRTQLRVLRGRDLLLSKRRIADVAQATGFSDQAHFTRTFTRVMGVPPGSYKIRKIVQDAG